ncbi:MAG: hypothetical protein V3V51_02195 [Desulfobacterales bacterium]
MPLICGHGLIDQPRDDDFAVVYTEVLLSIGCVWLLLSITV